MFLKSLYIRIIYVINSKQIMHMMKDIEIITYADCDYNDIDETNDYIFDMIIENYNIYHITDISKLWYFTYLKDLDELDEDEEHEIIDINNMNLSIINFYTPEIYENYEYENYEYLIYNEEYKQIFKPTLIQCANVLKALFSNKFYKYINYLEGDELSGADTDDN
jgi:hypothetical protein